MTIIGNRALKIKAKGNLYCEVYLYPIRDLTYYGTRVDECRTRIMICYFYDDREAQAIILSSRVKKVTFDLLNDPLS